MTSSYDEKHILRRLEKLETKLNNLAVIMEKIISETHKETLSKEQMQVLTDASDAEDLNNFIDAYINQD